MRGLPGGAAMTAKSWNYYLVKTARLSGWLLFLLVLLYIVTGFALCGELGVDRIIDEQSALSIHKIFEWPLVVTFVAHSVVTIYFAFRRWGWIKTRVPTSRSTTQAPADGLKQQERHAAKS